MVPPETTPVLSRYSHGDQRCPAKRSKYAFHRGSIIIVSFAERSGGGSLVVIDHPGVVIAGNYRCKNPMMTVGGLKHKSERCVRGALQDNRRFPGSINLQNDGGSCRSRARDQKATAICIPVPVVNRPLIQCDRPVFFAGSILNGKKVNAVIMMKIGESSAVRRKTPVVSSAADFHEFGADSALGVGGVVWLQMDWLQDMNLFQQVGPDVYARCKSLMLELFDTG